MHCSCLSWGLGAGGGVTSVQRHMLRGLGLNTATVLTCVAVSKASDFQPCAIETPESAGFDYSHSHSRFC